MAREVTHEECEPTVIDPDDHDGDIYICQCGLSGDKPFCDGAHTVTADEEDGVVYKYEDDDSDQPRRSVDDE